MAVRRSTKLLEHVDHDAAPAWQRQSVDRSLRSARARAHARSDRFVAAATELLQEKGTADFTVQDVVERSRMSIRTFYKYFASKEDLLVAVSETVIAREAVPRLRASLDKHRDPLLRLRAFIECISELTDEATRPVARMLASHQNRLAESRPADLARAMRPLLGLLVELIEDVARTSPLANGLTAETAARLTHYVVLTALHARVFEAEGAADVTARMIWQFCLAGMGIAPASPRAASLVKAPRGRRPGTTPARKGR